MFINNIPVGNIPFLSSVADGQDFTALRGLIPGIASNLEVLNPIAFAEGLIQGGAPDCMHVVLPTIDDNGNEVPLGTEGSRQVNAILGNPEPDFVMNYINSINYKNFTLGFHFQHVSGGDMYSSTIGVLLGRGNVRSDRRETFVLEGVNADGSPNTIMIIPSVLLFIDKIITYNKV